MLRGELTARSCSIVASIPPSGFLPSPLICLHFELWTFVVQIICLIDNAHILG